MMSAPTRFGIKYREELRRARNVEVFLHANVLAIDPDPYSTRVAELRVVCLYGPRFSVRARVYVLATGGIENARLLLLSDRGSPNGLGNQHGLVGRFFMEHTLSEAGFLYPGRRVQFQRIIPEWMRWKFILFGHFDIHYRRYAHDDPLPAVWQMSCEMLRIHFVSRLV